MMIVKMEININDGRYIGTIEELGIVAEAKTFGLCIRALADEYRSILNEYVDGDNLTRGAEDLKMLLSRIESG